MSTSSDSEHQEHRPSGEEERSGDPAARRRAAGSVDAADPAESDPIIDEDEFAEEEPREGDEMGFFEHLEELRSRIIKSLIALVIVGAVCGVFYQFLVEDVLFGPANRLDPPLKLQNFIPMGTITLAIQVVLVSALILTIPVIIWQFWAFIKPGLYKHERKYVGVIAVATIFCFVAGVAFAYFVMVPTALGFAGNFTFQGVENQFAISEYFSFVLNFILASGVVFELPMLSYALSRFGIVTPAFMKTYRRHAIVVILILAALITPTPDPINQLMLAGPLYGLYELSIMVSKLGTRQRDESMQEITG